MTLSIPPAARPSAARQVAPAARGFVRHSAAPGLRTPDRPNSAGRRFRDLTLAGPRRSAPSSTLVRREFHPTRRAPAAATRRARALDRWSRLTAGVPTIQYRDRDRATVSGPARGHFSEGHVRRY